MKAKKEPTPKERLEELLVYVNTLKNDHFMLADWVIDISEEPCQLDCHAAIGSAPTQKKATIRMAWDWHTRDADGLRHSITHELCHLHWEQAWEYVRSIASADQFKAFEYIAEYGVDAFARMIAPTMPLPEFSWAKQ